jgi:hypothetical protein
MCEDNLSNCTYWDLVDPLSPDYFTFRVKTTYPGDHPHLSAVVQMSNQEMYSETIMPVWVPEIDDPLFPKVLIEEKAIKKDHLT